jgi:transposase
MSNTDRTPTQGAAIQPENGAFLVSLELSQSRWLVTLLQPDSQKFSRHMLKAGESERLLRLLDEQRSRAETRCGGPLKLITIYEAGLDGFWLHRLLEAHGIESHVVDPGSIAAPRRQRRAKSDRIDGETLIRVLAAWRRGEPRVCSMLAVPSVAEEDRRRITRERQQLLAERVALSNRIRGLLAGQGVHGYDPLRKDRRRRMETLRTGDGGELPACLKTELLRLIERLELTLRQIEAVENERDAALAVAEQTASDTPHPAALLLALRGIGEQAAIELWLECLYRQFPTARQLAAYGGLAATPWRSGSIQREQGISKAGNPRVRRLMIQLAWLWQRYQPDSALSRWFRQKVKGQGARARRIGIVALARKLLVALWRYVEHGVLPEGVVMKAAGAQ